MTESAKNKLNLFSNVGMAVFGVVGMLLVSIKNPWGFVIGLASQPFFFISSILHKQWGLFIVNVFYTVSWIIGIYVWFFKG